MKKALRYLGLCSEGRYGKDVEDKLFGNLKQTYHIMRAIICVCVLARLLLAARFSGSSFDEHTRAGYLFLYICIAAVTVFFIALDFVWELKKWKKYSVYRNLGFVYVICTMLWACAITLLDQLDGNGLTVYTYMLLSAAALAVLEPWQSIMAFGGAFAVFNAWLPRVSSLPDSGHIFYYRINSLFIALIAIVISVYFNWCRTKSYCNQKMIDEQNRQLYEVNERLSGELIVDSLTGLYNRRYLSNIVHSRFHDCINRTEKKPVSCLMMDVDYFKQYNDTYGHQKGDECLVKISELMRKCLPMESANIIRYGGEEFVIFIFSCGKEQALNYAEKLREVVEKNRFIRKDIPNGYLTVSMGVYTEVPDCADNSEMRDFIRKADEALYEAKRAGRNCVRVHKKESAVDIGR